MSSGDLFLGDIARAFAVLRPTDQEGRHAIIRALGFEPGEPEAGQRAEALWAFAEAPPVIQTRQPPRDEPRPDAPAPPPIGEPAALPHLVARDDPQRPAWMAKDSQVLEEQREESIRARLSLEPLFKPSWTRGILGAALATAAEEGAIDVERMIDNLARGRPIRQVPRARVPTLRNGLHIVLDKREAMNPFLRDQAQLLESVRRIVGREATLVFDMARTPLRVRRGGTLRGWFDYRPPPAGTPVLLVTDLGIGQPAFASDIVPHRDWHAFAQLLRQAGCPALAFVPYPRARWPEDLIGHYRMLAWDRRTTAAMAARALRGRAGAPA
ncbi:MAG TPA: hypothetical protein VES39_10575 [Rhodospirillales bacterium]|nr:hypothetical protein [Rhodospirillales bacterium]